MTNPVEETAAETPGSQPQPRRKRRLLLKILLAIVLLVGGFLAYVAAQPAEYRVARSATINAPPDAVFAQVNDFHNWQKWSPWAELDPNAKVTFEGPAAGVGAVFKWSGNDDVGEGSMTLIESRPHEFVHIDLKFVRPFEDSADVTFSLHPQGEQTAVTWAMSGKNNFFGKLVCLFMDMDQMIGADYEKGLAQLKAVVEKPPQP